MDNRRSSSRRAFLRLGLGAAAVGAGAFSRDDLLRQQERVVRAAALSELIRKYQLAGTDGWASLPQTPAIPIYHPDPLAPSGLSTYIFGFTNVTGLDTIATGAMKNHAQISAPILYFDELTDYIVTLSNLGLKQRPDLVDSHTLHWHGFRNAIPMFDGEPSSSVAVPIGRTLDYFYRPRDPGTYMYHCHFEDTEHVHMGMTGTIYVRPKQNSGNFGQPAGKYAYNDGDGSTRYDREYVIFLSEIWAQAHWDDAHIQAIDWSEYKPDFYLMNGRTYPDTLLDTWSRNPADGSYNTTGGRDDLRYQPISSLIKANAGEKVLLRFVNLSYTKQSMTLGGIKMKVIGKDANLLRGRDSTDLSFLTNTLMLGPGESAEAIFTAPSVTTQSTYLLYNRAYQQLANGGGNGPGGQMTEVRISPAGTLGLQLEPNT